ncbi:Probable non-ribosomal peptide synthetase PstA [Mycobacteroides abscessus subsp. abscessus]|nr:Probable non-ribosomal peptide synthetase PstA [Mycobacteroides abscessus subsp. abscessus]
MITAACALLVHGEVGGAEVVLDFPVSRRVRPEALLVPGMSSGVVPLRLTTSPYTSVADFCEHVATRIQEALRHQRFPLRDIESKTGFQRGGWPSRHAAVNFIPTTRLADFAGAAGSGTVTHTGLVDQFGLVFIKNDDELFLSTSGVGELFPDCDARTLADRFERVLSEMTADPRRPLSAIDVRAEAQCPQLDLWSNRGALTHPVPRPLSIPELFAEQVVRDPGAVAVSCGGRSVSYRGLDEASNRLAHLLISHGVGPGQRVALLLSRSVEAVVAIMGVLKTGAAYVPIDPSVPDVRLRFVLCDAGPVVVVTTAELADRLGGSGLVIIDIDDVSSGPGAAHIDGPQLSAPCGSDIAYVIYTSGTTGTPKGVAIPHHNVTRLLEAIDDDLELVPGQGWAQCHSLAFDFSVWEIFGALLHGMSSGVVPLRLTTSPYTSVADFCEHVATRIQEALRHQRFPLRDIESKTGFQRGGWPSRHAAVNFIPTTRLADFAGAAGSGTVTHTGLVDQFGLVFIKNDDELFLSTSGVGELFPDCDARTLADRFERVLSEMTADPRRPLSAIDVRAEAQCPQLDLWSNRGALTHPVPRPLSIPELFAEQVVRDPGAVAVSCGGRSVSYRGLDEASNRLAHLLISHGVGPGQRVALLLSRSVEAVVAIMGVLKTGAAYVPIDPSVPDAR